MSARQALLQDIARSVLRVPKRDIVRIAIDGVDGAGKTVFADELARALEATGGKVIRASIDGFHNSASIRYRRGRASPEGFFADSYNYEQLRAALLDPLSPGGTRRYRTAVPSILLGTLRVHHVCALSFRGRFGGLGGSIIYCLGLPSCPLCPLR